MLYYFLILMLYFLLDPLDSYGLLIYLLIYFKGISMII